MHQTTPRRPLRRALAAGAAGLTALAVLPSAAMGQTADPPPPRSIDDFCLNVPDVDSFSDVDDDDPWAPVVRCLSYAGITNGVSPDVYAPERRVTRAQMASFIARMSDTAVRLAVDDDDPDNDLTPLPDHDGGNPFADVPSSSTHLDNINRLARAGIAEGVGASSFAPERYVTRAQMASFITRALEHVAGTDRTAAADYFTDDDASVHEHNINTLAVEGIVAGYGDGTYRPDRAVSRAQMASFLVRPLALLVEFGFIEPMPGQAPVNPLPPVFVSEVNSTATTTDNGNGTAIISFVVRNRENVGVEGLTAADISLVVPGGTEASTIADLMAEAPGTWTEFTEAAAGEGVYTVLLDPGRNITATYTDITTKGVEIHDSLDVTVTGAG